MAKFFITMPKKTGGVAPVFQKICPLANREAPTASFFMNSTRLLTTKNSASIVIQTVIADVLWKSVTRFLWNTRKLRHVRQAQGKRVLKNFPKETLISAEDL